MRIIMPRVDSSWVDQILVVDGGSTDGTVAYSKEMGYEVVCPNVRGMVPQLMESFNFIKGDIIILFSPDGNSIPEVIPDLANKIEEGFDMVIASRYTDNSVSYDDDSFTRIGNYIFTKAVNIFFRANYTDVLVIFRAFRLEIFKKISVENICDIDMHLSIQCSKKKLRVTDIPADEPKRVAGKRKITIIGTGLLILYKLVWELFNYKK